MSWFVLGIFSALFLGLYDISKKQSLKDNSVVTVLTLSVCISSLLLLPMLILSRIGAGAIEGSIWYVPQVDVRTHLFILGKSALVLSSWVFAYIAMKNLPITIVSPINATRPMWTLLGAMLIFGEQLNIWQWFGVAVCLISFYGFSIIGQKEGFEIKRNKWMWCLIIATLLGASSGLYDKYLMRQFDHNAVQVYYTFYQAAMMLIVFVISQHINKTKVSWHWSIALISIFLVASDFVYLLALSDTQSLISVLSAVRRSGVIVSFFYGIFILHDHHPKTKTLCLLGVILGLILLFIGSK